MAMDTTRSRNMREIADLYVASGLRHWQARHESDMQRAWAANEWEKAGRLLESARQLDAIAIEEAN